MYQSHIKKSQHAWEKQNLVTIVKSGRAYDEMTCKNCGMKGKRFGFESVEVSKAYKLENVNLCPKAPEFIAPTKVKVTLCTATARQFQNLLSGSIHAVVEPPSPYKNDSTGVWVMGVGEPVKLLSNEFIPL